MCTQKWRTILWLEGVQTGAQNLRNRKRKRNRLVLKNIGLKQKLFFVV
jgi:hypothetical protein